MSACCFSIFIITSVACAIGPSVNPLQNRETQHVNIVLQSMNWKVSLQVVTHVFSTDFSFQNLVFFGIYLNFQGAEIIFKSISPIFWIHILPNKFHTPWNQAHALLFSSRAFQRDQECNLKHPGLVDLIGKRQNKTNKQPCFIDRFQH